MVQKARPEVIINGTGWTGAVSTINEATQDDGTYIESGVAPDGSHPLEVRLASLVDPEDDTGHTLKYSLWKSASGGNPLDVLVELVANLGVSEYVVDSWSHTGISHTPALFTRNLADTDVDDVTADDYAAGWYVRFTPVVPASVDAPTVTSFDEAVIPSGQVLTITGTNLTGATSVWFGSTEETASVVVNSDTEVEVTVPALAAGVYAVEVETPDGTSTDGEQITVPSLVRNTIGSHIPSSDNTTSYPQDVTEALAAYARVIAWVAHSDTVDPVQASGSGWGITWTNRGSVMIAPDANFRRLCLLDAVTGAGGAAADEFTAGFADAQTGCLIEVAEYTYSPACPFVPARRQVVADDTGATSTSPVSDLAPLGVNAAAAAGFIIGRSAPAITPGSGWDELLDTGYSTPSTGLAILGKVGTTDDTISGTWSSGLWNAIGVEVG